jgi:N-acetylmuramoyl-L-alanine amidase
LRLLKLSLFWCVALPGAVVGQDRPTLVVERGDGSSTPVSVDLSRGYAAVRLSVVGGLGWSVSEADGEVAIAAVDEITISMKMGSPFFRWDGVVLQLTDAPYRVGNQTFVPLQFISDFLPRRLPGLYEFDGARSLLRAGDLGLLGEQVDVAVDMEMVGYDSEAGSSTVITEPTPDVLPVQPGPYEGVRVVVIDAGHGGGDPGALGPDGIREKTVALSIATRLAALLGEVAELEVHLIRDDDTFVALWERGQIATDIKGERPGIFVSIHANSFPARREARGFETYFLSDARTEHERRVSAIENAPLSMSAQELDSDQLPELDFILRDLKNYDHAHWSEELASLVQNEMNGFHPGPNRGVKQGLLAVLTNALMPSILIEVGYLSNAEEGRLIGGNGFHQDSATAIADAVARFFERYPPGSGGGESDDH